MLAKLSDLRITEVSTIPAGTVVLPVYSGGHSDSLALVVEGGAFTQSKALVPLGGLKAFVPQEVRGRSAIALGQGSLHVRFGDLQSHATDKYCHGQMGIDEDGPYIVTHCHHMGRARHYLLNLRTWKLEEGAGLQDPAFWPAEWELVFRGAFPTDDLTIASSESRPSDGPVSG